MLIRQPFIQPSNGHRSIKDIHINIEEMRSLTFAEPTTQASLVAKCDDHVAIVSPNESLSALLDAKRTYVPYGHGQSRLVNKWQSGRLEVMSAAGLDAKIGDPIAVMADSSGTGIRFYVITEIIDNGLFVVGNQNCQFWAGAIVQNLRKRWWTYPLPNNELGVHSRLTRPEPVSFIATYENELSVNVTIPINITTIRYYDVYVRSVRFTRIESHWLPDVADVEIGQDQVTVKTYDGGEQAGGGSLVSGTYYVTIITKDGYGDVNVNESDCRFVEMVKIS